MPLGGRATYTLTIRHPRGDRVQLPARGSDPFGPFEAVGTPAQGERDEGLVVASTYAFNVVALEPGSGGIPPLAVSLVSPDGKAYELAAPAVAVEVTDPTANEPLADLKMKGAKGADGRTDRVRPYVVYVRDWTLAWILGIAGGVLLVAGITALVTRAVLRRRRAALPSGPPPVPPYPAVRERLALLRVPGTYTRMGAKPFHVEVADAVKEYLGRRHDIDALEMTSEELLDALEKRPAGGLGRVEMELFLGSCDIVKFARGEPTEPEALDVLGTGERIVEQVERAMVEVDMRRAAAEAARAAAQAAAAQATQGGPAEPSRELQPAAAVPSQPRPEGRGAVAEGGPGFVPAAPSPYAPPDVPPGEPAAAPPVAPPAPSNAPLVP
ncbi:MAG: hypothetical protein HY907_11680, partial [Deltaproteobacteria bacterium]|nr:hypothetical protein [Deltaproteobacteria bacterium]